MVDIPENKIEFNDSDISEMVDDACGKILSQMDECRNDGKITNLKGRILTEEVGGYPMSVCEKVGKMFVEKGWFVYFERTALGSGYPELVVYRKDRYPDYDRIVEKMKPEHMLCLKVKAEGESE